MKKETAMIERTKELAIMQLETRKSAHNSPSTPHRHSPILRSTASRYREARRDQSKYSTPDSRTHLHCKIFKEARTEAMTFTANIIDFAVVVAVVATRVRRRDDDGDSQYHNPDRASKLHERQQTKGLKGSEGVNGVWMSGMGQRTLRRLK